MRNLLLTFILLMVATAAFSYPSPWPSKEVYDANESIKTRGTALELVNTNNDAMVTEGRNNQNHIRIVWEATDTATPTSQWDSGFDLPANAIPIKVIGYVVTPITSTSDNEFSLTCSASGSLYASTDLTDTASGSLISNFNTPVVSGGTLDSGSSSLNASACDIIVDISSGASGTATGKLIFDIDYIIGE